MTARIPPEIRKQLQMDVLNAFLNGTSIMSAGLSNYDPEVVKEMVRSLKNTGFLREYGRSTSGRMYRTTREGREQLHTLQA